MSTMVEQNLKLVWAARSEIRGTLPFPAGERYILCLVFLKFLDDLNKSKPINDWVNSNTLPHVELLEIVQDPAPERRLDRLMVELEQRSPSALRGVLTGLNFERDFASTPGGVRSLSLALFAISRMDLQAKSPDDRTPEETFERLIEQFSTDKSGGFETPREVADLITSLIDPKPGDSIYDPFCRSGSILSSLFRYTNRNAKLSGQESTQDLWAICKMNLSVHGAVDADVRCSDALRSPLTDRLGNLQRFDVVASNPPFGQFNWHAHELEHDAFDRFRLGIPPKNRVEYAFLLHMIESAKEDYGKVALLLPMGALFRGGSEGRIRKRIVEENLLDCVVALPANLFYGTGIPVALLLLCRNRKKQSITFVDASRDFEKNERSRNKLAPEHTDAILEAVKGRSLRNGYSRIASMKDVREHDYNLSVSLYVSTEKHVAEPNMQDLQREIDSLGRELSDVSKALNSCLDALEQI